MHIRLYLEFYQEKETYSRDKRKLESNFARVSAVVKNTFRINWQRILRKQKNKELFPTWSDIFFLYGCMKFDMEVTKRCFIKRF